MIRRVVWRFTPAGGRVLVDVRNGHPGESEEGLVGVLRCSADTADLLIRGLWLVPWFKVEVVDGRGG